MELLKKQITITEAVFDGTKVKIKDQDGVNYTFFAKKQDGNESVAYQFWKTLDGNGKGVSAIIGYGETQGEFKGSPVTYRNIATMTYGQKQSFSQTVAQVKTQEVKKEVEQDKWDAIAFGKCKTLFLVEAFKGRLNKDGIREPSQAVETICEKWAEACMRKLPATPSQIMQQARKEAQEISVIQQEEWIPEQINDEDLNALFPN